MSTSRMIRKAYEILGELTPLVTDCGKLCGDKCCRGSEADGMLLFPGEEEYFMHHPDFRVHRTAEGALFAVCDGHCKREERPLSCRIFPYIPAVHDGKIEVQPDLRAAGFCPVLLHQDRVDRNFLRAVRKIGYQLLCDKACAGFLERLTGLNDDLLALAEKLNGSEDCPGRI